MKRSARRRRAALILPALLMALLVPTAALAGCTPGEQAPSAPAAQPGETAAGEPPAEDASPDASDSSPVPEGAPAAPADPPEGTYADPADFAPAGEVEGLADRPGISGDGSDTGYYSFRQREDASALLCYLDYATGREVVLCSQPNCTHDSDTCPAWYPFVNGLRAVPVGDRLIVLQGGSPNYVDLLGVDATPKIQVMNPDGSDRREAFAFPASSWVSTLPRGGFARDDAYLYFTITDQSAGANARTLCAADGEGRVFALCALPEDEERIAGGDGQSLILTCMPGSSNLDGTYTTQVRRLDLTTLQETTLFSYPADARGVCGQGDYYVLAGNKLQSYSLTDGSLLSEAEADAPGAQALYGVYDGKLLISGYTDQGEPLYYGIDTRTGARTDLPYIYSMDGSVAFGEILAGAGEDYVCIAGEETFPVTYPALPGEEPMRASWLSPAYGLADRESFWAGAAPEPISRATE